MKEKLYKKIASIKDAIKTCEKRNNAEWKVKHNETLNSFIDKLSFDCKLDDKSTSEKLIFTFDYHHIDSNGYYTGWSDYTVIVKPSLQFGINIRIVGKNISNIKDYFHDVFYTSLNEEME